MADRLIEQEAIKIKTSSDKTNCNVTGCVVLNTNKLVLVDYENKKIKLISLANILVQIEKSLDARPFDIAKMDKDHFAVTLQNIKEIVIMKADDNLSLVRSIKVDKACYGIAFNQNCLYVACSPSSVIVLDTLGNTLNDIPLSFLSPNNIPYIAVSKDSNLLYISDYIKNRIVSFSLQDEATEATATYRNTDLQRPQGMLMLDDGSLFVCCYISGTIHKVNGDLTHGHIMCEGVDYSTSICYSTHHNQVYVGCHFDTMLKVFSTE